jgi:uncharacterized protein (DUF983 family)
MLRNIVTLRCPVCNKGKLFKGYLDTPERCPECGYYFMRETGYFLPHAPIGYLPTVAVAFSVWPIMYFLLGVRSDVVTIVTMVVVGILFGLWFNRYAKMIWLAIDLTLHPPAREDFERRGRH